MAKKNAVIKTPKDLAHAIRTAKEKDVRACLLAIAEATLLDMDTDDDGNPTGESLNENKNIDGADFISMVSEHLTAYGFWPTEGWVKVIPVCAPGKDTAAVFGVMHVYERVMHVYERVNYRTWKLPRYVVCHKDGRVLEDFRTKDAAFKWAKAHQNG